ncbi:hypothetical protein ACKKBG_A14825 [Auxenochlorella protothecoides x Auxenochlorella symbiontica]
MGVEPQNTPQPSSASTGLLEAAYQRITAAWVSSAQQLGCMDVHVLGEGDVDTEVLDPAHAVLKLNSGHTIPVVGLGVYLCEPGAQAYEAVLSALRLGYRHIDTAQVYGNESDVGRAVRDSGIPRKDIFVTSKLSIRNWGKSRAQAAIDESLKKLGLDYIDLFLLHAPGSPDTRAETWAVLESYHRQGKLRSIGVSNFGVVHLEKLAQTAQVTPAVNQIELHPFLQWPRLVQYCRSKDIIVEAYSPLAKGQKLDDPTVKQLAQKLNVTPAQLLIRWGIQKGFVSLPKSTVPARQEVNLNVFSITIPDDDMATLDGLEADFVTGWDPIRDAPV